MLKILAFVLALTTIVLFTIGASGYLIEVMEKPELTPLDFVLLSILSGMLFKVTHRE